MRTVLVLSLLALCFSQLTSSVSSGEDSNTTDASAESNERGSTEAASLEPTSSDEGTEGRSSSVEAPPTGSSGESMESRESPSEERPASGESSEQSSEESGEMSMAPTASSVTPTAPPSTAMPVTPVTPVTPSQPVQPTTFVTDQPCPMTYLWCAAKQKCLRAWEEPCPQFGPASSTGVAVDTASSIVAQNGQDVPAKPDVAQTPPAANSLYPSSRSGPAVAPAVPYVPAVGRPLYVPAGSSTASQSAAPATSPVYTPAAPATSPVYTPATPQGPAIYTPPAAVYTPPAAVYTPPATAPVYIPPVTAPAAVYTPPATAPIYIPPASPALVYNPPITSITPAPYIPPAATTGASLFASGTGFAGSALIGGTTTFPPATSAFSTFPAAPAFPTTTILPAAPAAPAFPSFAGTIAPLRPAGCVCGQFCSANGITGTCQADGLTCAQNIIPPQCGIQTFGFTAPRG